VRIFFQIYRGYAHLFGYIFIYSLIYCIFIHFKGRKKPDTRCPARFRQSGLLLLDGTHGAGTGAGTAGDAGVSVDVVLGVALGDGAHGALLSAGAAGDASIGNLICHGMFLLRSGICILTYTGKKSRGKVKKREKNSSKQQLTLYKTCKTGKTQ
jgi:hypothetical protein